MSITRYNKIFNFSSAVIILYNALCLINAVLSIEILGGIISKTAVVFIIFAVGMLIYKISLTRYYFLGRYAVINLILHCLFTVSGILLILITT